MRQSRPAAKLIRRARAPHPLSLPAQVTAVFCTLYYLLYMATSAILLLNLLVAMIIRTCDLGGGHRAGGGGQAAGVPEALRSR